MALRHLALVVVVGCGDGGELEHVAPPAGAARPLQITGNSRFELWSPVAGGPVAEVAYTRDSGRTWRTFEIAALRGDAPLVVAADNRHRAWITGTTPAGTPGLVAVTMDTGAPVIADHSAVFPPGTSDVVLASGGFDPDPMITARVPGSPDLALFLLRETIKSVEWIRHPLAGVRALVGIYVSTSGYFVLDRDGSATLAYCNLPDDTAHCLDVPAWKDTEGGGIKGDFANILPSAPTPQNDWLWRGDPGGGELVHRTGATFDVRRVAGWPDPELAPIRFFALESGELGVLAARGSALVWVALDAQTRVIHETVLGDCADCALDPARLVMLPDASLAIPSPDGWYLVEPRRR